MRFMFKKKKRKLDEKQIGFKNMGSNEIDTVSSYEQKPMLKN